MDAPACLLLLLLLLLAKKQPRTLPYSAIQSKAASAAFFRDSRVLEAVGMMLGSRGLSDRLLQLGLTRLVGAGADVCC